MMRTTDYPINEIFTKRRSIRAMSGEELCEKELFSLFEAARWAPSSRNAQPWRFVYARRNSSHWDTLFSLLTPPNQVWAKNGSVLILILSKLHSEKDGRFIRSHSLDVGAAWQNFALQAISQGLVTCGIGGFDHDKAKSTFHIPDSFKVEMMAVVGKQGTGSDLSHELQEREKTPTSRKPICDFISEGTFSF